MESLIRQEHGTGKGFGAVSNTGSSDCLKEQFRNLGVQLGAKFDRLDRYISKPKKVQGSNNQTEQNIILGLNIH